MQTVEELEKQLAEARANSTQTNIPTVSGDPYAATSWAESEYDFRVPSGQLCRLRKLQPEELVGAGILDQLTKLPGAAQEQIDKAEGKPPVAADALPSQDQVGGLLDILNKLLPMVIVQPKISANPEPGADREPGKIYVMDIELADRIAILERTTGGVNKFDAFRKES